MEILSHMNFVNKPIVNNRGKLQEVIHLMAFLLKA